MHDLFWECRKSRIYIYIADALPKTAQFKIKWDFSKFPLKFATFRGIIHSSMFCPKVRRTLSTVLIQNPTIRFIGKYFVFHFEWNIKKLLFIFRFKPYNSSLRKLMENTFPEPRMLKIPCWALSQNNCSAGFVFLTCCHCKVLPSQLVAAGSYKRSIKRLESSLALKTPTQQW